MKPHGLLMVILGDSAATPHVDDDYAWYLRQAGAERPAAPSLDAPPRMSIPGPIVSLARHLGRRIAPEARRLG